MTLDVVSIPATFDLNQVSRAIMGEEAYRYQFKGNEIKTGKQGQYNEASFDYYADGPYPRNCIMQLASQTQPVAHTTEWQGQMLVQNRVCEVVLYRASS